MWIQAIDLWSSAWTVEKLHFDYLQIKNRNYKQKKPEESSFWVDLFIYLLLKRNKSVSVTSIVSGMNGSEWIEKNPP